MNEKTSSPCENTAVEERSVEDGGGVGIPKDGENLGT
jgi:hypothetical protein